MVLHVQEALPNESLLREKKITDVGMLLNEVFEQYGFFLKNLSLFENFYLGLSKLGHTNSTSPIPYALRLACK